MGLWAYTEDFHSDKAEVGGRVGSESLGLPAKQAASFWGGVAAPWRA